MYCLEAKCPFCLPPFDLGISTTAALGKPQKKVLLIVDSQLRHLAPPPPRISGKKNGYKLNQKNIKGFFLSGQPLPPLSGLSTKK